MKKRIISFISAIALGLSAMPFSANALDHTADKSVINGAEDITGKITIFDRTEDRYQDGNGDYHEYEKLYYKTEYMDLDFYKELYPNWNPEHTYYESFSYIQMYRMNTVISFETADDVSLDTVNKLVDEYNSANGTEYKVVGIAELNNLRFTDRKTNFNDKKDIRNFVKFITENDIVTNCKSEEKQVYLKWNSSYPLSYHFEDEKELDTLKSYVEENNLTLTITTSPQKYDEMFDFNEDYESDWYYYLIPENEITDMQMLETAQQIYDELGIRAELPYLGYENDNSVTDTTVIELIKYEQGDANCDGNVNLADAVMIMQSLANPDKYGENGTDETHITEQGEYNGDMDNNGLTNADALEIQKIILKLS